MQVTCNCILTVFDENFIVKGCIGLFRVRFDTEIHPRRKFHN